MERPRHEDELYGGGHEFLWADCAVAFAMAVIAVVMLLVFS